MDLKVWSCHQQQLGGSFRRQGLSWISTCTVAVAYVLLYHTANDIHMYNGHRYIHNTWHMFYYTTLPLLDALHTWPFYKLHWRGLCSFVNHCCIHASMHAPRCGQCSIIDCATSMHCTAACLRSGYFNKFNQGDPSLTLPQLLNSWNLKVLSFFEKILQRFYEMRIPKIINMNDGPLNTWPNLPEPGLVPLLLLVLWPYISLPQ